MTTIPLLPDLGEEPLSDEPRRHGTFRRLLRDPVGSSSAAILLVIVVAGLLAPVLMPHDPYVGDLALVNSPPGDVYWLGGDSSGRDILSRLIAAINVGVESAVIVVVVSFTLGISTGLIAGYFGHKFDSVASWISNLVMALPGVILLIALFPLTAGSTEPTMVILGILIAPGIFRLVRNMVVAVKNELYVDAARVAGLSSWRILSRHIFYVIRSPLIIQAAFISGVAISVQAGLSFIGVGNTVVPNWGTMLNDGFQNLYTAPNQLLWAGLMLGITTTALVLLGNALRDLLEGPRTAPKKPPAAHSVATGPATGDPDVLLRVDDLHVAYPNGSGFRTVVNGVSLEVHAGEILGLVGESGSGKTQTAFAILGLLPAQAEVSGRGVMLNGVNLLRTTGPNLMRQRGMTMAYVPQEPMSNLDPSFTVGNQLVYGIRAASRVSKKQAKATSLALLDRVGIVDPKAVFRSYPHQISGGMAQRILIAGAIACNPKLLIADEPTTALDVTVQAEILDLLRDLQRERQMGVILVTHNFGVVADLCDRVAVMRSGEIVETGDVLQIFHDPQHEYTRELLHSILDDTTTRADLREDREWPSRGGMTT